MGAPEDEDRWYVVPVFAVDAMPIVAEIFADLAALTSESKLGLTLSGCALTIPIHVGLCGGAATTIL